jgi:hypothetical protein
VDRPTEVGAPRLNCRLTPALPGNCPFTIFPARWNIFLNPLPAGAGCLRNLPKSVARNAFNRHLALAEFRICGVPCQH